MDRVQEIEAAISNLPPDEFRRLTEWLHALEQTRWDAQLDRDSASGKLDFLFDEAGGGQDPDLREWPPQKWIRQDRRRSARRFWRTSRPIRQAQATGTRSYGQESHTQPSSTRLGPASKMTA